MTSGWSGQHYAGIPAGTVGTVNTMKPALASDNTFPPAPIPGLSYYRMRGQEGLYGAYSQDALYDPLGVLAHDGCDLGSKCGVPPMEYCRTLQCPRGSAPFSGGCVAPPSN